MEIGMIGLGKMGANMSIRLLQGGHQVIAYSRNKDSILEAESHGAKGAYSLEELVNQLQTPRIVWLMVPAGEPTESVTNSLANLLSPGDTIIDGGNSNYKDSIRRAATLKKDGISLLDVGTSGGIWGLHEGYCLMVGGEQSVVEMVKPILQTLAPAPEKGWGYIGASGSGHFVKMIHNGIEYGMMQAYAEGFEILHAKEDLALDLHKVAEIWRNGSVIRSWLLDLASNVLAKNPELDGIKGWVADSGEGRWTVLEAIDLGVPAPVITQSLLSRFASRQDDGYAARLLAALRSQFGGHSIKRAD